MTSIHRSRLADRVTRTTTRVMNHLRQLAINDPRGLDRSIDDVRSLRLEWFEVRNAAGDREAPAEPATIFVYDEIGGSFGVDAEALVHEIHDITAPQINVRINSPGGSVFDAIAIYNALNHHPAHVVVWVDSLAASAASVIAMSGDEIVMMPGSQMMIHDASNILEGNGEEHRQDGSFLDRQSDNIAGIYGLRTGRTPDKERSRMLDETWMFAQEAVDLGFADRVETPPARVAPEPFDGEDVTDEPSMTRSFDLEHFGYRYVGRETAPAPDGPRRRRAVTRTADRTIDRTEASERRRRAFSLGEPVPMPDMTTRAQTRAGAVGVGTGRELPFPAGLRAVLETRNGRDLYHVHGYATVFDKKYPMWDEFGEYEEVVRAGAADRTLASEPDVSFLVNHGGVTMARTTNGTLTLSADKIGMVQDAWLNPNRGDVKDIISAIEDELVTEMSFAFMIPEGGGWWSEDFTTFEIRRFDIDRGDVSAVNYGASPWTSITARARSVLMHAAELPDGMQRAFLARLGSPTARRIRQAAAVDLEPSLDLRPLAAMPTPGREIIPHSGRSLSLIKSMLEDD